MNASSNARVRSHMLSPVAMVYQHKQSHMKYWWTHVYLIDSSLSPFLLLTQTKICINLNGIT